MYLKAKEIKINLKYIKNYVLDFYCIKGSILLTMYKIFNSTL
jgi:hypothetical protein